MYKKWNCEEQAHQQKHRFSDSTNHDDQTPQSCSLCLPSPPFLSNNSIFIHLFERKVQQPGISKKLNEKAVWWLQSNCWTKGMDLESTLISIALYYCYKSQIVIQKNKLELILGTCIFLSSKITRSPQLHFNQISSITSNKFSLLEFEIQEHKLLQLLDYCVHFQFTFPSFIHHSFDSEEFHQLCFLIQVLLLRDERILLEGGELQKALSVVYGQNKQDEQIKMLLRSKKVEILENKYNSKFEVRQFMKSFETN